MRNMRRKLWIDRFQTHLSIRIALYFIMLQVSTVLTYHFGRFIFIDCPRITGLDLTGFAILVMVVLFGVFNTLFIWDAVKYTHRVVGPIVRFRKAVQDVTAGDELALIQLRKDDYLIELRDEFNEMLRALEKRGAVQLKTPEKAECVTSGKAECLVS